MFIRGKSRNTKQRNAGKNYTSNMDFKIWVFFGFLTIVIYRENRSIKQLSFQRAIVIDFYKRIFDESIAMPTALHPVIVV